MGGPILERIDESFRGRGSREDDPQQRELQQLLRDEVFRDGEMPRHREKGENGEQNLSEIILR